jgi:LysM repeat protein
VKNLSLSILILLLVNSSVAQTITPQEYIEAYKEIAVREMKRMGVPAGITLAQGILESECGNGELVKKSNNHFGIKCKNSWTAGGVKYNDDAIGECFRLYKTAEDSYRDHSNFLRGNQRYSELFKLSPTDYKGWSYGLKKAGYATNPKYPSLLIGCIEKYNLQQYTLLGANEVPVFDNRQYKDDVGEVDSAAGSGKFYINTFPEDTSVVQSNIDVADEIKIINGAKCIFAKKGTSLLVLATKNNVNLNKILAYNELAEEGILAKDQFVFLQKKLKVGAEDFYITLQGETVYDVSQKNGIQLQYLLNYNHLTNYTPLAGGTKLLLKNNEDKSVTVTNVQIKTVHTVKPKENLYSISKKYSVSVKNLKEWNSLTTENLSVGQILIASKPQQ